MAEGTGSGTHEPHPHASFWVLLVALLVGNAVLHFISRKLPWMPYTCAMLIMGVLTSLLHRKTGVQDTSSLSFIINSIDSWYDIDAHLMLYAFLPLLLFGDAMTINTHDFSTCFSQCVTLALPGVVIGVALTALAAYYILPFGSGASSGAPTCLLVANASVCSSNATHQALLVANATACYGYDATSKCQWNSGTRDPEQASWMFSLAFGSIAAATDPVAVVALLKEVGASSVLTMQITGESLLNDGVAMVLYTLFFRAVQYVEKNDGDDIGDAGSIIRNLVQFAFGGVAVGYAFGRVLMHWLKLVSRKTVETDSMVQLMLTVSFAYSTFFFAEGLCHVSGVLATVTTALVLAHEARPVFISFESIELFWHAIEMAANSVIFFVTGLLVGRSMTDGTTWADFGYLLLFWILANIIRGTMLVILYPILKRTGYSTTPAECVFMCWGGLRGAVGLALALAARQTMCDESRHPQDGDFDLNATRGSTFLAAWAYNDKATFLAAYDGNHSSAYMQVTREYNTQVCQQADRLVFYVGGVAALTLLVNGLLSAPLLRLLGLLHVPHGQEVLFHRMQERISEHTHADLAELRQNDLFHLGDSTTAELVMIGTKHVVDLEEKAWYHEVWKDLKYAERKFESTIKDGAHSLQLKARELAPAVAKGVAKGVDAVAHEVERVKRGALAASGSFVHRLRSGQTKVMPGADGDDMHISTTADPEMVESLRAVLLRIVKNYYWHAATEGKLGYNDCLALTHSADVAADKRNITKGLLDWGVLQGAWPFVPSGKERILGVAQRIMGKPHPWLQKIERMLCCLIAPEELRHGVDHGLKALQASRMFARFHVLQIFSEAHRESSKKLAMFSVSGWEGLEVNLVQEESKKALVASNVMIQDLLEVEVKHDNSLVLALTSRSAGIILEKEMDFIEHLFESGMLTNNESHHLLNRVEYAHNKAKKWIVEGNVHVKKHTLKQMDRRSWAADRKSEEGNNVPLLWDHVRRETFGATSLKLRRAAKSARDTTRGATVTGSVVQKAAQEVHIQEIA